MSSRPTVLLVHGAFFTPSFYEPLVSSLYAAGYDVECPFLPTCADSLNKNVEDDLQTLRSSLSKLIDSGRQVLVLMHSYGGVAGTEAIEQQWLHPRRLMSVGGVIGLVYLCAMLVPGGGSIGSVLRKYGWLTDLEIQTSDQGVNSMKNPEVIMNDVAPEMIGKAVAATTTVSTSAVTTSITQTPWKHIPTMFIFCERDRAIKYELQRAMVRDANDACEGRRIAEEVLQAGHCPFLDGPKRVVECVDRAWEASKGAANARL